MQLPFGHKGGEAPGGAVPVEEVKKLKAQGKADRDIIVELKKQGHSFESIEKAMLQVLRNGSNSAPQGVPQGGFGPGAPGGQSNQMQQRFQPMMPTSQQQQGYAPRPQQFNPQQGVLSASQNMAGGQRPQGNYNPNYNPQMQGQMGGQVLMTRDTLNPQANMNIQAGGGAVPLEAEAGNPTDLIEEVVEGVVEEKFAKADQKFEYLNKELIKSKDDMESLKSLMSSSLQKRDKSIDDLKQDIVSIKTEVEDTVIKCNALERAFKQFLPELTEKVRTQNTEKNLSAK